MSRVQLAINVDNLDEAITFYSSIFQTKPDKIRPGYANYAIKDPPLKLVLFETPGKGGSINHLGIEVETFPDGIRIEGGDILGGRVNSFGDHRIAMAFSIAGLRSASAIEIQNCNNVATSFPGFIALANQVGINLSEQVNSEDE